MKNKKTVMDGKEVVDLLGIGIGPFNLSLAALLEESGVGSAVFLEQKPHFSWHDGMLLPGTTLQVPFLADLVSLVAPTSRFSFLNYLHAHDRLYKFYFFENFHIPRREYDHYCRWVSEALPSLKFGSRVTQVEIIDDLYRVTARSAKGEETYYARNLVLGTGTQPMLPACLRELARLHPDKVMHTAEYSKQFDSKGKRSVLVLGSGQSAAEVVQSLMDKQFDQDEEPGFALHWYTRADGFFPMEYSKLGLEHFTPDYTKYFTTLEQNAKDRIVPRQGLFYKGISFETISSIYDRLYHLSVGNVDLPIHLRALSELSEVSLSSDGALEAHFDHSQAGQAFSVEVDAIIAGTGYRYNLPDCVEGLKSRLKIDSLGRLKISSDYAVEHDGPGNIFIQNGELHTHGIGAPDLGLGAWRAARITNTLFGREIFRLPERVAFQQFGIAEMEADAKIQNNVFETIEPAVNFDFA